VKGSKIVRGRKYQTDQVSLSLVESETRRSLCMGPLATRAWPDGISIPKSQKYRGWDSTLRGLVKWEGRGKGI